MPAALPEIPLLIDLYDEAFDKKSWHGPNLRSSVRGISAKQAAWRPEAGRHNIWEITVHAAYWKYVVRRRLTGDERGTFPLKGSNFFPRPLECTEAAWRKDIELLETQHQDLRRVLLHPPASLYAERKRWQAALHTIRGIAAHDFYHAGQIRLLRRLAPPGL